MEAYNISKFHNYLKTMKTSKLLPDPVKILALLLGSSLSILAAGKAHAQTANLFASVNHPASTGNGAIFEYTPAGAQSTFVASIVQPRGLAFDSVGNLFVASTDFDVNGNAVGTIFKVTHGGVVSTVTTAFPNNFFLEDIKFDSMGNLFVFGDNESDPNLASTIFKVSPGGVVTAFGAVPGQGFGLAFDSMGNLFAADAADETIFKFTSAGGRSVFAGPTAFVSMQGPEGLAFDSAGNLFASTADGSGNGQIFEFAPNGAETTFATGLTKGPRGLAFDSAGNLFVAELSIPNGGSGDILKFTPAGAETVFATPVGRTQGNGGPEFLVFPVVSAVSRMTHGGAGTFDINLPLTGTRGVECRSGGSSGNYSVVFTFVNDVTSCGSAGTAGGSVSSGPNTNQCTENLTGVPNAQYTTVTLNNVVDSQSNSSNVSVEMGVLVGDTTANGAVDSSDIVQTQSQSGQAVTADNFREDVTVNGFINSSDISLVQSQSGIALPTPPSAGSAASPAPGGTQTKTKPRKNSPRSGQNR